MRALHGVYLARAPLSRLTFTVLSLERITKLSLSATMATASMRSLDTWGCACGREDIPDTVVHGKERIERVKEQESLLKLIL